MRKVDAEEKYSTGTKPKYSLLAENIKYSSCTCCETVM